MGENTRWSLASEERQASRFPTVLTLVDVLGQWIEEGAKAYCADVTGRTGQARGSRIQPRTNQCVSACVAGRNSFVADDSQTTEGLLYLLSTLAAVLRLDIIYTFNTSYFTSTDTYNPQFLFDSVGRIDTHTP